MKKILKYEGSFPISNAILYDKAYVMEISGQIGVDAKTGELVEGIELQTAKTLENIKKILQEVGWDFTNIIKTRVYLSDMRYYSQMNKIYETYFKEKYPARVAMAVKELPRSALIEIEATACGDQLKK
ncbi:MAG: hypothetical protein RL557_363 [archaeon]|jgi:2-iminobutanoate/2-iminopropanoate deaminase